MLDYRVMLSSDGGATYTEVATGLTVKHFVKSDLTAGVTYTFVVHSRNAYEYSNDSTPLNLLCATTPLRPD